MDSFFEVETDASRFEAKFDEVTHYRKEHPTPSVEIEEVENPVLPYDSMPESQRKKNLKKMSG